jgi:hypothetical protein
VLHKFHQTLHGETFFQFARIDAVEIFFLCQVVAHRQIASVDFQDGR